MRELPAQLPEGTKNDGRLAAMLWERMNREAYGTHLPGPVIVAFGIALGKMIATDIVPSELTAEQRAMLKGSSELATKIAAHVIDHAEDCGIQIRSVSSFKSDKIMRLADLIDDVLLPDPTKEVQKIGVETQWNGGDSGH